jgi:hypothetical protein
METIPVVVVDGTISSMTWVPAAIDGSHPETEIWDPA